MSIDLRRSSTLNKCPTCAWYFLTTIFRIMYYVSYIDGLKEDCSNSIANTQGLLQSCAESSIWWETSSLVPWWRHQMETISELLARVGNSPVTGDFPSQRPVTRSYDVFFDLRLNIGCENNRDAGDLRRNHTHHDITVMLIVHAKEAGWVTCDINISWKINNWYSQPISPPRYLVIY